MRPNAFILITGEVQFLMDRYEVTTDTISILTSGYGNPDI